MAIGGLEPVFQSCSYSNPFTIFELLIFRIKCLSVAPGSSTESWFTFYNHNSNLPRVWLWTRYCSMSSHKLTYLILWQTCEVVPVTAFWLCKERNWQINLLPNTYLTKWQRQDSNWGNLVLVVHSTMPRKDTRQIITCLYGPSFQHHTQVVLERILDTIWFNPLILYIGKLSLWAVIWQLTQ